MSDIITNINDGAAGIAKLKKELTAAIQEKGGSADSGQPLTAYPDYVRSIPPEGNFITRTELEEMGLVTQEDLDAVSAESAEIRADLNERAKSDLSNIDPDEVAQTFKNMAISWNMPDYTAGVDIAGRFAEPGGSYTVPYDCCIVGAGAADFVGFLYTRSGCAIREPDAWSYVLLAVDGASNIAVYLANKVYIPKGMTVYGDIEYANTCKLIMYPLKGADK